MSASYSPEQRALILARYRGALEAERATDSEVRRAVTQMQADLTLNRDEPACQVSRPGTGAS
jgi:hypothetical protein